MSLFNNKLSKVPLGMLDTDVQNKFTGYDTSLADMSTQQTTNTNNIATNTTAIANIGNGSPKGTYATLTALQTAYPTGTTGVYIVTADGGWYYWSGSAWTKGGTYQTTGLTRNSISPEFLTFVPLSATQSTNLFNKDTVISGSYIAYQNGTVSTNASFSASDWIVVQPNTAYIKKTNQQLAFYDSNKTYISGLSSATTFTTPANCYYVRLSITNATLSTEQLNVGGTLLAYESSYNKLNPNTIPNGIVPTTALVDSSLLLHAMQGVPSKNLFNQATAISGSYISYVNGNLSTNASFYASDYIPVQASTTYTKNVSNQFAFYDVNKTFISGITDGTNTFTTPANAYYVRLTIPNASINTLQLELGGSSTPYVSYGDKLPSSKVSSANNIITVKADGTGNFTNLSSAIASITNSGSGNIYDIYIYEGTYDVYSTLTSAELTGSGILLPDYVNLYGVGDKNNIIIKMSLSDTTTLDESSRLSPLNVKYNNILKNLTVTAKNCRYAVHSDNGNAYTDYTINVENCTFIHYGNAAGLWNVPNAWGEGTASGAKLTFKNCDFIGYAGLGYNTHNNTNFAKPDYHEFENCKFITKDGYCVGFTSLSSGKICRVLMKGCKFTGKIKQDQSNSSVTTLEYQIEGFGNEKVPHDVVLQAGQTLQKYIHFSEEISLKTNYSGVAITRGTPVKAKYYNQAIPMLTGDDKTLLVGLVAKDCLATDMDVVIKTSGYFPIANTSLTGIATGDKIGIVNGVLAKVTNSYDAFAVAIDTTYLKFL